jgi:hypothetical protein
MDIFTPQKGLNLPTSTQNATFRNINSDLSCGIEWHFSKQNNEFNPRKLVILRHQEGS